MTTEKLMQPRVCVIALYPPLPCPFKVGDVLVENVLYHQFYGVNMSISRKDIEACSTIFKNMEWCEGRKIEDMPKYLKGTNGEIFKVLHFASNNFKVHLVGNNSFCDTKHFLPSTEIEYLAYCRLYQ